VNDNTTIILTTLAEYQTAFWVDVILALKKKSYHVIVLSYDDRSCELLDEVNICNYNVPRIANRVGEKLSKEDYEKIYKRFDVDNANFWQTHERLVFKKYSKQQLDRKFVNYLVAIDVIFREQIKKLKKAIIVQELGGFISVLAAMFVARKYSVDNYFLEPSFFKGRLFILKNTISAPHIPSELTSIVSQNVRKYIISTIKQKRIVVPDKDSKHYNTAFKKLADINNIKRLVRKLIDKYFLGKYQEFGHIIVYVGLHVKMFFNARKLRKYYLSPDECGNFIYFPFHVPNDVAITLRSPEYYDQLALVEYIARIVPHSINVAVKEHPAMIGAIDAGRLGKLLKTYDNLKLISPSVNNYEVLESSDMVVTINSKSGAEAVMLGKKVCVLGDAFYKNSPLVIYVDRLTDLPEAIRKTKPEYDMRYVERYFQTVWNKTVQGELYVNNPKNIQNFVNSMICISTGRIK